MLAFFTLLLVSAAPSIAAAAGPQEEHNKKVVVDFYEKVYEADALGWCTALFCRRKGGAVTGA